MTAKTYWRSIETPVRTVRVRIGHAPSPAHWAWSLAGQERDALAIDAPEGIVLIDDEQGVGMAVVSRAFTSDGGYKRLPADSVILSERA